MRFNLRKSYQDSVNNHGLQHVLFDGGEAFIGDSQRHQGYKVLTVFLGNQSAKAAYNYAIKPEKIESIIDGFKKSIQGRKDYKEQRKVKDSQFKKDLFNSLKPGQIFHCSWGYSMTINEYYRIKEIKGKTVWVEELCVMPADGYTSMDTHNHPGGGYSTAGESTGKVFKATVTTRGLAVQFKYSPDKPKADRIDVCSLWDGKPDYENHCD